MKLRFSEYKSDYDNYIFPYVIWAYPEEEHPSELFGYGFLPSGMNLQRFYMCRHVRVCLADFKLSSENRRILRKGEGASFQLLKCDEFEFTDEWRQFCKNYADERFGTDVMTFERLDSLFQSSLCTHILKFVEKETGKDLGIVVLYMNEPNVAFYYYSFFDLNAFKNLGMYMMTCTVQLMQEKGYSHIYLGSCYKRWALYKTQFEGCEFWNGHVWSCNIKELKYMIERDNGPVDKHLLETPEYIANFMQNL